MCLSLNIISSPNQNTKPYLLTPYHRLGCPDILKPTPKILPTDMETRLKSTWQRNAHSIVYLYKIFPSHFRISPTAKWQPHGSQPLTSSATPWTSAPGLRTTTIGWMTSTTLKRQVPCRRRYGDDHERALRVRGGWGPVHGLRRAQAEGDGFHDSSLRW